MSKHVASSYDVWLQVVCLCPDSSRSFIKKKSLSLSLIGSSYDGVSVNDVIFSGRTAVQDLLGGGL